MGAARRWRRQVAAVLLIFTAGLSARMAAAADSAPAIAQLRQSWQESLRAKNVNAIMRLYASDAVFIEPDGTKISGLEAIRKLMQKVTAEFDSDIVLTGDAWEYSGHLAYDRGTYRETMTPHAAGPAQKIYGTYLMVLRRESGRWHILVHSWTKGP